jgi:hypothetical protein
MKLVVVRCAFCGSEKKKESTAVTRANKEGRNLYCDRRCAGKGRRTDTRTADQKRADKAEYDRRYRDDNKDLIKKKKSDYFRKTYDPIKAAEKRKINMHRHIKYCQQPQYVEKKKIYDRKYKAKKNHGEYWESAVLALQINDEILKTTTKYQISIDNGTFNKKLTRRREYERLNSNKSERSPLGNA